MAISNKVGPPVTGEDFFGRTNELRRAHELLDSGHSLVLSAPRRIGKSSFAKRLIEDKKAQGWKCAYIDLEGIRTKDEFLQALITQFNDSDLWVDRAKAVGGFFANMLGCVSEIGPVKVDFSKIKMPENLYQSLSEVIDHEKDTLIVIDELTLFLGIIDKLADNTDESSFFLNWFRSLRQVNGSRIRWIFCGSVGLHNFTRTRHLSMTINDLAELNFDAMSEHEAKGLVIALAQSEGVIMGPDSVEMFLDKLNWHIPYFIQLLFTTVKADANEGEPVTEENINTAFRKISHSESLSTWSERLAEYNGQERGARYILRVLAASEEGVSKSQLLASFMHKTGINDELTAEEELSSILNMLEHDGYLLRADGGVRRFRSPLLKEWWRYKFVD